MGLIRFLFGDDFADRRDDKIFKKAIEKQDIIYEKYLTKEDKKFIENLTDEQRHDVEFAKANTKFRPLRFEAFKEFHDNIDYLTSYVCEHTVEHIGGYQYEPPEDVDHYRIHEEVVNSIPSEVALNKQFVAKLVEIQELINMGDSSSMKVNYNRHKRTPLEELHNKYKEDYDKIIKDNFKELIQQKDFTTGLVYAYTEEINVFDQPLDREDCKKFMKKFIEGYNDKQDKNQYKKIANSIQESQNAETMKQVFAEVVAESDKDGEFVKKAIEIVPENVKEKNPQYYEETYNKVMENNENVNFWVGMAEHHWEYKDLEPKHFEKLPATVAKDKKFMDVARDDAEELFAENTKKYPKEYSKYMKDEILDIFGDGISIYALKHYGEVFNTNEIFSDKNIADYKKALLKHMKEESEKIDLDDKNVEKTEIQISELEEYKSAILQELKHIEKERPDNKEKDRENRLANLANMEDENKNEQNKAEEEKEIE